MGQRSPVGGPLAFHLSFKKPSNSLFSWAVGGKYSVFQLILCFWKEGRKRTMADVLCWFWHPCWDQNLSTESFYYKSIAIYCTFKCAGPKLKIKSHWFKKFCILAQMCLKKVSTIRDKKDTSASREPNFNPYLREREEKEKKRKESQVWWHTCQSVLEGQSQKESWGLLVNQHNIPNKSQTSRRLFL